MTHIAGFMSWTLDPLGQSLMYLTALVVLLRIDARLTLAVFLPLLLMLLVVRLATARIQRYRREAQEAIGGVTGLLGELFGAVLAVKVAGAEERIVERLRARGRRAGGPPCATSSSPSSWAPSPTTRPAWPPG